MNLVRLWHDFWIKVVFLPCYSRTKLQLSSARQKHDVWTGPLRDTATQKLNQGRLNLAFAPLQLYLSTCFRPTNEKTHQKTCQLRRLVAANGGVAQYRLYSQATSHQNKVSDINIFFNGVTLASSRGFSSYEIIWRKWTCLEWEISWRVLQSLLKGTKDVQVRRMLLYHFLVGKFITSWVKNSVFGVGNDREKKKDINKRCLKIYKYGKGLLTAHTYKVFKYARTVKLYATLNQFWEKNSRLFCSLFKVLYRAIFLIQVTVNSTAYF